MSEICTYIHQSLKDIQRHKFPFEITAISLNGIYILYESNETGHLGSRIVRVGTHTGKNQLRSRIQQHFIKENKDRSIFRKNIGRALLNRDNDPFLEQWNWDLTTRKSKDKYGPLLNRRKQEDIEKKVTKYITNNFSFIVLPVPKKEDRLFYEARLISTISLCNDCHSSIHWLGSYSPIKKIAESGLWQVNELYKEQFSFEKYNQFMNLLNENGLDRSVKKSI